MIQAYGVSRLHLFASAMTFPKLTHELNPRIHVKTVIMPFHWYQQPNHDQLRIA